MAAADIHRTPSATSPASRTPTKSGTTGGEGTAPPIIASLTYNNIRANALGDLGQFRTMKEKFGWRVRRPISGIDPSTRKTIQFDAADVESASWICSAGKEYQLKVVMRSGETLRFDGFKDSDYDTLAKHLRQHWQVELKHAKLVTRGWHWGVGRVTDRQFVFEIDGRPAFDLSSQRISQVSTTKTDVAIVMDNEEARADGEDQLLELRLFIPPSKNGDDEGFEAMRNAMMALPGSQSVPLLQTICSFADLKVLVPAGRFDIQVSRRSMKLIGKSNDFTVDFSIVTRMYLLPSSSSPHVNLVLSLSSPLRKGHTPYHNVIVQFDAKKVIDLPVSLTEEEIKAIESENPPEFQTALAQTMSGEEYDLAARILKALTGKALVEPGEFRSSTGQCCFRSSYKADSGNFYPLQQSFIFIPKPVIIINYEDIVSVTFGRTSGSQTKLFEFDVVVRSGQTLSFSSVDRQESTPFIDFLNSKDIRVRSFTPDDANEAGKQSLLDQGMPSDDESDDEDFQEQTSEEDDDEDDDDEGSSNEEDVDEEEQPRTKKARSHAH